MRISRFDHHENISPLPLRICLIQSSTVQFCFNLKIIDEKTSRFQKKFIFNLIIAYFSSIITGFFPNLLFQIISSNFAALFNFTRAKNSQINPDGIMKSTVAMVLLLGIVCVVMAQKYPNKFDNVNIDSVLNNDRVLSNYIKCLLDKGACTHEGRELKSK